MKIGIGLWCLQSTATRPRHFTDVYDEMLRLTVDVLCGVAFSYDTRSVEARHAHEAPLYSAFKVILETMAKRDIVPDRGNELS